MGTVLNTGILLSYDLIRSSCTRLRVYEGFELWLNKKDKSATIIIVLISRSYATYNDIQLVPFQGYMTNSRYQSHIIDFIRSSIDIRDLEYNNKETICNKEKLMDKPLIHNSYSIELANRLDLELFTGSFNRYVLKCTYMDFEFWKSSINTRSCICIKYIGRHNPTLGGMQVTRYAVYISTISSVASLQSYIRELVEFN